MSSAGVVAGVRWPRWATVVRGSNPTLQAHVMWQKGVVASLLLQPLFATSHDAAFNFWSRKLGLRTVAPIVRVVHGWGGWVRGIKKGLFFFTGDGQ